MNKSDSWVPSVALAAGESGELLHLSRDRAGWDWMSFSVRRMAV